MKKYSVVLGVTLSAGLIVVSLLLPVNHFNSQTNHKQATVVADGDPLPLPPPPPPTGNQSVISTANSPWQIA